MPYIDSHAHLDQAEFNHQREAVLSRSREAGVEVILSVGTTADSSEAAVQLAEAYCDVFAAVGIQPNYCAEARADDWDRIVSLAGHSRVVAVGETGLDRYWDFAPLDVQRDYFARHLELAADRDLPVVVHCRNCEPEVSAMVRDTAAGQARRGVLHAFSGTEQLAETCLEAGLHISFAGMVTYTNKKFRQLRDVAKRIPDDRLLIETDSPYLVPHPLRGKQKRNEPALIVHTARCLAELRGCRLDELSALTPVNARRLFRVP